MPLNPEESPGDIMHELKKTRKKTKNPSRKSAAKHGTSHEQDIAIMLNTKRKAKGAHVPPAPKKKAAPKRKK